MDTALEEIEFLALSANRVQVLDALSEDRYTRRELVERTGASQPTLGRVLRDLTERHWIERDGDAYEATATGRLVAAEFTDLLETLETEGKLREVMQWLPTEEMGFDLRHLSDATITTPSQTRPGAPVQRVLELLERADRVRILSYAFNEQSLDVIRRRAVEEGQTFQGVFSPAAVDVLAHDSALRGRLRELIRCEDAEIRLYDGEIPLAVTITDDVAHLFLRDENGLLRAAIDSDDPEVLAWAEERHERYWREASPLDADELAE